MRSRYTAHTRDDLSHLAATWHPDHRPATIVHDPTVRWLGLEIVDAPVPEGAEAVVEFVARFRSEGQALSLHERSRFERVDGVWLYTDGDLLNGDPGGSR